MKYLLLSLCLLILSCKSEKQKIKEKSQVTFDTAMTLLQTLDEEYSYPDVSPKYDSRIVTGFRLHNQDSLRHLYYLILMDSIELSLEFSEDLLSYTRKLSNKTSMKYDSLRVGDLEEVRKDYIQILQQSGRKEDEIDSLN